MTYTIKRNKIIIIFMKILVIGSGGREHALVWKLAQSGKTEKIWAAPGNGGTADEEKTENLALDADLKSVDPSSEQGQNRLLEFCKKENIDLVIVGPEAPLAAGIVDNFRSAGLAIIGPDKKASQLETSKIFSSSFMNRHGIRSPKRRSFTDAVKAMAYINDHFSKKQKPGIAAAPLVIKADGLAAGKGVVITQTLDQARDCISLFMKKASLGDAGKNIVIEEFLEGREVSIMAAVSVKPGKKGVILPFITARDHKRRFEGGKGPNTGGMGAIAPVADFTNKLQKDFETSILLPTLKGMEKDKMTYQGFIFFGVMIKQEQCYLLEYNVRLGDPETQVLLPLMNSDLAELCLSIWDHSLGSFILKWKKKNCCAPVLVSSGYPDSYKTGFPIAINPAGLKKTEAHLFIAGANKGNGGPSGSGLRTSGGRVMAISAVGDNEDDARKKAYKAAGFIGFNGMAFRKDIGNE